MTDLAIIAIDQEEASITPGKHQVFTSALDAGGVCAWDIWIDVKLLPNLQQGGSARLTDTAQRRHCQFVVIWGLINSTYLQFPCPISRQWQPAKPRTGTPIFCFTALLSQSAFLFDNWRVSFNLFSSSTGYGDGIFSILSWVLLPTLSWGPVRYNWSVCAREMHSTSEFAKIVLSKCVIHAGFAMVAWTLRGIPF